MIKLFVECLLGSYLISLAALTLTAVCRSARVRHRVGMAAFFALAVLPALSALPQLAFSQRFVFLSPGEGEAWIVGGVWAVRLWALVAAVTLAGAGAHLYRLLSVSCPEVEDTRLVGIWRSLSPPGRAQLVFRPGSPATWGMLNPLVSLPAEALEWPEDLVRSVLLHELEHVERYDWGAQVATLLLSCLYWCNPLLPCLRGRIRADAELLCDAGVVAKGISAPAYAEQLLALARQFSHLPGRGIAIVGRWVLRPRIEAVLTPRRPNRWQQIATILVGVAVGIAAGYALYGLHQWTPLTPARLPLRASVETWPATDDSGFGFQVDAYVGVRA